jgi:HAD superfamily hydrolase (TIGR01509 family)
MTIKALIFDMDGLLLDSEKHSLECFLQAAKILGYPVKEEVYLQCIGTNMAHTEQILRAGHDDDFPYAQLRECWDDLYFKEITTKALPIKAGVIPLLDDAKARGLSIALATSTHYQLACVKLKNAQLFDYFSKIVAGDYVEKSKPNPQIYLRAAQQINLDVKQCLAFEDSENGVLAAFNAGLNVIQIPDLVEPSAKMRQLGHSIKGALTEVDLSDYM